MIRKHSIKIKYNDTNISMDIMRYSTLPNGPLGENTLKKYQLNWNLKEEKLIKWVKLLWKGNYGKRISILEKSKMKMSKRLCPTL